MTGAPKLHIEETMRLTVEIGGTKHRVLTTQRVLVPAVFTIEDGDARIYSANEDIEAAVTKFVSDYIDSHLTEKSTS